MGFFGATHFGAGDTDATLQVVAPETASLLGGDEIVAAASDPITGYAWVFDSASLDSDFTTSLVGTGTVTAQTTGVLLQTGATNSSIAMLTLAEANHFVAVVQLQLVYPSAAVGTQEVAFVDFLSDGDLSLVGLRIKDINAKRLLIFEHQTSAGLLTNGGALAWDTKFTHLVLVRTEDAAWAYAGTSATDWTLVGAMTRTGTDFGALRVGVKNGTTGKNYMARVKAMQLGPGLTVNGRLATEMQVREPFAMSGVVPAAPFDEVGKADVVLFGPRSGRAFAGDLLTYVHPRLTVLGADGTRIIRGYAA